MPCDSRISINLDALSFDPDTLEASLKAAGFTVTRDQQLYKVHSGRKSRTVNLWFTHEDGTRGSYEDGKLAMSVLRGKDTEKAVNGVRQAYSSQVVKDTAKRFGWTVTTLPDGKLEVNAGAATSRPAPKKGW